MRPCAAKKSKDVQPNGLRQLQALIFSARKITKNRSDPGSNLRSKKRLPKARRMNSSERNVMASFLHRLSERAVCVDERVTAV